MRIVFNLQFTGLGNNGGSRTLIKCAEALADLGHDVIISASSNKYTWHKKIKVPITKNIPECDIIIATGVSSVKSTLNFNKAKKKFYYIRGFEIWVAKEKRLIKTYKSLNCIVNSEWLRDYLTEHQIRSELIYPGLDFNDFYVTNKNRENIIGGIFSKRHKTKRHEDVIELGERLGYKVLLLNRDIKNPTVPELRDFYNKISVWVSPSELEGLHNCPHEAALCGCSLVVTNHKQGGVSDYANDQTALIYPAGNLNVAAERVKQAMTDGQLRQDMQAKMGELLETKIGSREQNMKKMIEIFDKALKRV